MKSFRALQSAVDYFQRQKQFPKLKNGGEQMDAIRINEIPDKNLTRYPTELAGFDGLLGGGFIPGEVLLMAGEPGSGKCLGKDTPVLMYNGSVKAVQNIKTGDRIMGDNSTSRTVLQTTSGSGMLYKVSYNNGEYYIVNENHILSLKRSKNRGKHLHGDILDIPLKEYLTKTAGWKSCYKGYRAGVSFNEQPIKINPYYLGVWLGDGHSANTRITSPDKEIISFVKNYSQKIGLNFVRIKNTKYTVNTPRKVGGEKGNYLLNCLREYKLLNNKHIPRAYKINSYKTRLSLLAGLIDSDGYYQDGSHYYTYTTKREGLANDVTFLARSLGFWVNKKAIYKKCSNSNSPNKSRKYYRLSISGDIYKIPCKVARKVCKQFSNCYNRLHKAIKVEPIGRGEYYGFELDGNGRFILGDFTVTHNSTLLTQIADNLADNDYKILYATGEENLLQIKSRANRLEALNDNLWVTEAVDLKKLFEISDELNPDFIIIDSLQTINNSEDKRYAIGSSAQMKSGLNALINYVKKRNKVLVAIGHSTKSGLVAGLLTLQHMVDAVFTIKVREDGVRTVKVKKNRFGDAQTEWNTVMTEKGLVDHEIKSEEIEVGETIKLNHEDIKKILKLKPLNKFTVNTNIEWLLGKALNGNLPKIKKYDILYTLEGN